MELGFEILQNLGVEYYLGGNWFSVPNMFHKVLCNEFSKEGDLMTMKSDKLIAAKREGRVTKI